MTRVVPVPEIDADEKVAQAYERVRDFMNAEIVAEPFLLYGRVPAFLHDFQMNFRKFVWSDGKLDARTKALLALVIAAQQRCGVWAKLLDERCRALGWNEQALADALAVAAACAMYNTFFKFRDLSGSDLFSGMGVGLRAHTFTSTSLSHTEVELINLVVSDVNGCKPCTSGHVERARQLGLSDEAILESIQCAATMMAGITFWNAAHA